MNENNYTIDDFVVVRVFIGKSDTPSENSGSATIEDIFKSHLSETYTNAENLKQYGIDVFKIKTGDVIKIHPSKWTRGFCNDKGIDLGKEYDFSYEVQNIEIKYYSKNPSTDPTIPEIQISIRLERI